MWDFLEFGPQKSSDVKRKRYTLAARLEQLNKNYGSRILIFQRTAELAGNDFPLNEVGRISVRDHENAVLVYEVSTT